MLCGLQDVFPTVPPPPKAEHPAVEEQVRVAIVNAKLVHHETWVGKVRLKHITRVSHFRIVLCYWFSLKHGLCCTDPSLCTFAVGGMLLLVFSMCAQVST